MRAQDKVETRLRPVLRYGMYACVIDICPQNRICVNIRTFSGEYTYTVDILTSLSFLIPGDRLLFIDTFNHWRFFFPSVYYAQIAVSIEID